MRHVLLFICLYLASAAATAQMKQADTAQTRHYVALALGTPLDILHSQITANDPLFSVAYEKRIHHFGIGGYIALDDFHTYASYANPVTIIFFMACVKANYYFIQTRRIDLYGGVMAGGMFGQQASLGYDGNASDSYGFKVGCQAGVHFWTGKRFGFLGEVAFGSARYNLGILFRRYK